MSEQHFPPADISHEKPKEHPGNGREAEKAPPQTLVAALEEMAAIDAAEWAEFIKAVQHFMGRKRRELDRRERLLLGARK